MKQSRKGNSLYEVLQKGKFPLLSDLDLELRAETILWPGGELNQGPLGSFQQSYQLSYCDTQYTLPKNIVFKVKTRLYQTETYLSKLRRQ